MARLFVAVRPPPPVLDAVEKLPRAAEPGVRWVPRSQWHVTLRFLGEAPAADVAAALREWSGGGVEPGSAEAVVGPRVSRLGRTVVCLPVAGLDALASSVARATGALGEPPDPRPFRGHLTLARLRHRGACRVAGAAFTARFAVTEVELVESRLRSSGAEHQLVERFPLP